MTWQPSRKVRLVSSGRFTSNEDVNLPDYGWATRLICKRRGLHDRLLWKILSD